MLWQMTLKYAAAAESLSQSSPSPRCPCPSTTHGSGTLILSKSGVRSVAKRIVVVEDLFGDVQVQWRLVAQPVDDLLAAPAEKVEPSA